MKSALSHLPVVVALVLAGLPAALPARTLIEAGAGAATDAKPAEGAVSAKFHREFNAADLKAGEELVICVCAADGEVISLNGKELDRVNMPKGPVDDKTLALSPRGAKEKGLFVRVKVPAGALKPREKNTIEVEVHAASAEKANLVFDLALKTMPAAQPMPAPDGPAKQVLETYRQKHYIAPGTTIPDGYFDGGRGMKLDAQDHASSHREILVVDRARDPELARDLEYAKTLRLLPPMERAKKLSLYVDKLLTPVGGMPALDPTMNELAAEFVNKPLRIGDVQDQYHAGVCRHRSLLFKVLADEAGLKSALVRGNSVSSKGVSGAHAWNEVQFEDGRRYLVDTMQRPRADFPEITTAEVTSAQVAHHYVRVDGSPWYKSAAAVQ